MKAPPVRYARPGEINIAYQIVGAGELDFVIAPGTASHLDLDWEWPARMEFTLARFDGPTRAISCADAFRRRAGELSVHLRTGVHTGEVEVRDDVVRGIAVHVTARIAALADPGEVLVSSTVRDLVAESPLALIDRGEHLLKGIPEPRRLSALTGASA